MRFQVTCEESNLCTLSWQRPPTYSRRHGKIQSYFFNCTTMEGTRSDDQSIIYSTYTSISLLPYRFYNCCVAAVNEAGIGKLSCQTIITHEAGKLHVYTYQKRYTYCNIKKNHCIMGNFGEALISIGDLTNFSKAAKFKI